MVSVPFACCVGHSPAESELLLSHHQASFSDFSFTFVKTLYLLAVLALPFVTKVKKNLGFFLAQQTLSTTFDLFVDLTCVIR